MNMSKMQIETGGLLRQDSPDRMEQKEMRTPGSKSEKEATTKLRTASFKDKVAVSVSVSGVWATVAGQINIRNATPREIMALSRQLYEAGAISYDDHINLSFQPEINPDTPDKSSSFSHRRKDYIALWQQRAEKVIRFGGDRGQIEDNHRIQAILSYIDSLK